MKINRRVFIGRVILGIGGISFFPSQQVAADSCSVQHPLSPPKKDLPGACHNCGMMRPMWARTFISYEAAGERKEVCSLHCLAEATVNSGHQPHNVRVALYHDPYTMIPAASAFYVVGSKARGTMTMQSKIAFAREKAAQEFAHQCGGRVVGFDEALSLAAASFTRENEKIAENRLRKGKIVEPVDNKDVCPVCSMYPARYPKNKCQIQTRDKQVVHFCSTQCLFAYLKHPVKYSGKLLEPMSVWVVDYPSGAWIYGKNAYFVIGSTESGPMGKEAFPFVNRKSAEQFATAKKGKVLMFKDVTIQQVME